MSDRMHDLQRGPGRELAIMLGFDALHLDYAFAGSHMLRSLPRGRRGRSLAVRWCG
jgi:hypothetical protein